MNIRRITASVLAALCLLAVACSEKEDKDTAKNDGTAVTTAAENASDATGFSDLYATVESVKEYYGDNVTFVHMADEYSDEVLMFSYGLMEDKFTLAVDDFVLTECDGMSADTFAVIKFKAGTDAALIEEAAEVMKTEYVEALKKKLAAYNPEEFEAVDGYQVKIYDDAIMMVISSSNAEAILNAVG